jgi:hypothetical protein
MTDQKQTESKLWPFLAAGHTDIVILSLILVLAVIGAFLRNEFFFRISLVVAICNFALLWYGLRKANDERVNHLVFLASHVTMIVVFSLLAVVGTFVKHDIIQGIDIALYTRILAWLIGFTYALVYSILKRVR